MTPSNIVIVAAKRTAIGSFNGSFSKVKAHSLGAFAIQGALKDLPIETSDISDVIMGQVLTAGQGQNPARQAALAAGLPHEITALTINQVCGSGLRAVALGASAIQTGIARIVVAGGQENMTLAPHFVPLRAGLKMGSAELADSMIRDGLWDAFNDCHMGITAENLAQRYHIDRERQDLFACDSQTKALLAQKSGKFKAEIIPVIIKDRNNQVVVEEDEYLRPNTSIEKLAKLPPVFDKNGTVTGGNASGINDGAAVLVLMSAEEANVRHISPLARIVSWAQAGVDPRIMGIGPVPASRAALNKAGWAIDDLDLIESNEAFAAQALAVNHEMGWDTDKVNVNGGAIALGHPIGASGARILVTLLHEMKRLRSKKGLATLCIGGGMGIALCLERD